MSPHPAHEAGRRSREAVLARDKQAWLDVFAEDAVEVMKRLRLPDGAVRVGIVHYNTADEVDRLLAQLRAL